MRFDMKNHPSWSTGLFEAAGYPDVKMVYLDVPPYDVSGIHEEAKQLRELFTVTDKHYQRSKVTGKALNENWHRLTLRGITKHGSYHPKLDGYEHHFEVPYRWCLEEEAPIATAYCQHLMNTVFQDFNVGRIAFNLLGPDGKIGKHRDILIGTPEFHPVHFVINEPLGSVTYLNGYEMRTDPGTCYVFDQLITHWLHNNTNVDRYHFIAMVDFFGNVVAWKKLLERSLDKYGIIINKGQIDAAGVR